jgi:hypothetical protein
MHACIHAYVTTINSVRLKRSIISTEHDRCIQSISISSKNNGQTWFSPFATRRYVFVRFSSKAVAEKVAGHLQYNHKCRWPPSQRSCRNKHTRDRCYDFLNIFAEKFSEKMVCLTQNKAKLCTILIITLVFEKNAGNAGNPGGMMHSQQSSMWQLAKHFCSSKKSFIQTCIDVYVHKHFYGPIGLFTRKKWFFCLMHQNWVVRRH